MQQFLYYGGSVEERDQRIRSDFDFTHYIVTDVGDEESVKIEEIRDLIKDLTLKKELDRLVYFHDAAKLTLPAQNSLLKTLEEPPARTYFILSVNNLTSLLPTIRSRVTLVKVESEEPDKNMESLALVKSAFKLKGGERVQLGDSLGKDRDTCLVWLDSLISSLYQVMQETKGESGLAMLAIISELAVKARTDLSANVNVALTMQHFFLSLPKAK